jgi:hypothetical protein
MVWGHQVAHVLQLIPYKELEELAMMLFYALIPVLHCYPVLNPAGG